MRHLRGYVALAAVVAVASFSMFACFGPSVAIAATECKTYDHFTPIAGAPAGVACVASAVDYPRFVGYEHVGNVTIHGMCDGLLPYDTDEVHPMIACIAPQPFPVWKWNGRGWVAGSIASDTRAWTQPYATGWRIGYTATDGWFAFHPQDAYIRWFTRAG
jgi:hypothetical protein